jgi:hypothetical protein
MRIDETDATELAQRLRLGPQELLRAIGGPWWIVERAPEAEAERPGTLFVGRAGPSVGVLVGEAEASTVLVGLATGRWDGPTSLVWRVVDPMTEVAAPVRGAASSALDAFVEVLRSAVDEAAEAKSPVLVTCRYCGMLVAPEHAFGDDCCQGCAGSLFGAVY